MKMKFICASIVAASMGLTGCLPSGSGGDSELDDAIGSPPPPTTASPDDDSAPSDSSIETKYTVSVDSTLDPTTRSNHKYQMRTGTTTSFTVVVVDTAGIVVEEVEIPADKIVNNGDGTWYISIPSEPRLDCLIIADPTGTLTITTDSNINTDLGDAILAPTTQENIHIDISSTLGYQNLLETIPDDQNFEGAGYDVDNIETLADVNAIIEEVKTVLSEILAQLGRDMDTLSEAELIAILQQLKAASQNVVTTQTENSENALPDTTLASFFEGNDGGISWFELDMRTNSNDNFVLALRNFIPKTGAEQRFSYDASQGNIDNQSNWMDDIGEVYTTSSEIENAILNNGQWVQLNENRKIKSINADGTVTIQNELSNLDHAVLSAIEVIDLSGRNIKDYLNGTEHRNITPIVEAGNFSEGARAVRIEKSVESEKIRIHPNEEPYLFENGSWSYNTNSSISDFLSASASNQIDSLKGIVIKTNIYFDTFESSPTDNSDLLLFELINDEKKTLNAYVVSNNNDDTLGVMTLVGIASWAYGSLISEHDTILIPYVSFQDGILKLVEDAASMITTYESKVISGEVINSGRKIDIGLHYNNVAGNDIIESLNFTDWESK